MSDSSNFFGDSIKVPDGIFDYQPEHCCPICGYENIHFEKVYPADYNDEKSNGIVLKYSCEAGHKFYIVIENHKGISRMVYTYENFNIIKSVTPEISENIISGEHNMQAINSGNNSQVNINNTNVSDEMSAELLKRFNKLSFNKKLDIFNQIKNK